MNNRNDATFFTEPRTKNNSNLFIVYMTHSSRLRFTSTVRDFCLD